MKEPLCIDVGRAFPPPAITPCTFQPSTAPAPFLAHTKGRMRRVEMLCRDLAFYASFCLCFWLPRAIRRHSSVPKQTLYWCASRFFIFLCLADCFLFIYVFIYFYRMVFGSKPSDCPRITQTRLLLMGIHLGPTFLSVSDFFTFSIKSRKSPTTTTSLIKETGRCEIPLCKCIPSMVPHWRGANIEASPVRSLCRREKRSTTRRTCITSCTRVIIFTWTVHIPAWDMHPPTALKTVTRTAWVYHKAAECAVSTKGRTSQALRTSKFAIDHISPSPSSCVMSVSFLLPELSSTCYSRTN